MKTIYEKYLFEKQLLVSNEGKHQAEALITLANCCVLIKKGGNLASLDVIKKYKEYGGCYTTISSTAFYLNFPMSVRTLSVEEQTIDRAVHYINTYCLDNFDTTGHSLYEKEVIRSNLADAYMPCNEIFSIITEKEAAVILKESVKNLLSSTRPIAEDKIDLVAEYMLDNNMSPDIVKNRDLKITLYHRGIPGVTFSIFDIVSIAEHMQIWSDVDRQNMQTATAACARPKYNVKATKLRLTTKYRKELTKILRDILTQPITDDMWKKLVEKRGVICGIIHHIHFKPISKQEITFVNIIRDPNTIKSYNSDVMKALTAGDIKNAILHAKKKGTNNLLRSCMFLISRCNSVAEVDIVLSSIGSDASVIVLTQLLNLLDQRTDRVFTWTKFNTQKKHIETEDEKNRRKSIVSEDLKAQIKQTIRNIVREHFKSFADKNKDIKIFIDPAMKKIAMPLQETTASTGGRAIPRGSRSPIGGTPGKPLTVRAFTYWEKVNDIDLSISILNNDGSTGYIGWRSRVTNDEGILFSGDQTSGFNGGSEYYDIDVANVRKMIPNARYIVLTNNVYSSDVKFSDTYCIAGYMVREKPNSGEIFDPKTVKSVINISANSKEATVFMIDLLEEEIIWLNTSTASMNRVSTAGNEFLKLANVTKIFNVYDMYDCMYPNRAISVAAADLIISDAPYVLSDGQKQIQSCDIDILIAALNA